MTVDTKLQFNRDYISQFSKSEGEPEWFLNVRQNAFEKIEELPLPKPDKTKIDNWNFLDFKHKERESAQIKINELPIEIQEIIDADQANNNLIIQKNGANVLVNVSSDLKNQGVIFTDIITAAKEHGELLQKYYMKDAVKVDEHKLTALNAAFVNGGIFLYVPKNIEVKDPVQAIFWMDGDTALFNHVIIVTEDNSSVTYIENYFGLNDEEACANIITEVIAGANSNVKYGAVDTLAKETTTYVNRRGITARNARIEWALGQMNDGNTVSDNTTNLIGEGSFADSKTVTVGRGEQKQNFTTQVIHFGKATEGYILNHGVMKESATSIFNGIGKIEHGASKSNAEQTSRVLMLSETARGDANPILLIDEDDVTAGHAASVGRVDPNQLYYLMSRGIPKVEAERLVIHGFLAPVVRELPIQKVQNQLTAVIERKVK